MAGGLMELVAYGAQDVYLTGNPQITFFKVTYQRHTNFAQESIEQTFSGTVGAGQRCTCIISRSGDLVGPMHLEVALPALSASVALATSYCLVTQNGINSQSAAGGATTKFNYCWVPWVGYRLIQSVSLEIGGQRIDKHYAKYFYIWHELSTSSNKDAGLKDMVGGHDFGASDISILNNALVAKTLFVPLIFWFNTHPGLALPLIALQYHEVKLIFEFAPLTDLVTIMGEVAAGLVQPCYDDGFIPVTASTVTAAGGGTAPTLGIRLFADYYFLDTEERRRFAQLAHEYLIKQVQEVTPQQVNYSAGGTINVSYRGLNHPTIFNVWALQNSVVANDYNDWINFTNSNPFDEGNGDDIIASHKLVLNGNDRYATRDVGYFNLVQPYQHFPSIPPKGINVFSYALQPAEHQPSGTLNFSRIDNSTNIMSYPTAPKNLLGATPGSATLVPTPSTYDFVGYAVNYNILRIMSGMGGLAYSN
jgi:hypothetical protein